jgi:hypothetical protein
MEASNELHPMYHLEGGCVYGREGLKSAEKRIICLLLYWATPALRLTSGTATVPVTDDNHVNTYHNWSPGCDFKPRRPTYEADLTTELQRSEQFLRRFVTSEPNAIW